MTSSIPRLSWWGFSWVTKDNPITQKIPKVSRGLCQELGTKTKYVSLTYPVFFFFTVLWPRDKLCTSWFICWWPVSSPPEAELHESRNVIYFEQHCAPDIQSSTWLNSTPFTMMHSTAKSSKGLGKQLRMASACSFLFLVIVPPGVAFTCIFW